MKKPFNTENLEAALTAVFVKSIDNHAFRRLSLYNPRAAIAEVAPYLYLPEDFQFKFVTEEKEVVYYYVLPPVLEDGEGPVTYAAKIIDQDSAKTHPPTDTYGTDGDPNGDGKPHPTPPN